MAADERGFTVGVEEEFLLVDAQTRALEAGADEVVSVAEDRVDEDEDVDPEFKRSQLETATPPCESLGELRQELVRLRREVIDAADRSGCRIGAAGTHPFPQCGGSEVTPKESYMGLEREYQRLAREKIICGCHVHVGMPDPESRIQTLNRVRPWLSTILALAVNSPFWAEEDTGYGSFRTEIWRRWPTAGTPAAFASRRDYEELVELLLKTESIDDPARIFWDVRPSPQFDTLEFRLTDVCLTVDEAVMVAGLVRALAMTCHGEAERDDPFADPRPEVLRSATWRAARYGLEGELMDVAGGRVVSAEEMVDLFLERLRPALEDAGEWDEVSELVGQTVKGGTGASRQREAFARSERLEDVVDFVVEETARGT